MLKKAQKGSKRLKNLDTDTNTNIDKDTDTNIEA